MLFKKIPTYWVYLFLIFFILVPFISISKTLILAILFLAFIIFVTKKVEIRKFPLILFLIAFLLRLAICLVIKTEPVSDFAVLFDASRSINMGDLSFNNSAYFYNWAYQIGFVYIQSLFLRIVDSVMFLKIINSIITSFICVIIYYIAREFMKEEYAKTISLFYTFMIFPLTYVTVLTNQHLSALFIYLGLLILISSSIKLNDNLKYLIAGILISIGNIIRPEGIVTIFSIILFLLITLKKNDIKNTLKKIIILLIAYYAIFFIASGLFKLSKIGPYGLTNNAPYWKLVLGFNYESKGMYNASDYYVLGNEKEAYELIKSRIIISPIKMANLFMNKIDTFWNSSTLYWSMIGTDNNLKIGSKQYSISPIADKFNNYNQKCLLIMYILCIIGIYNYKKKKDYNNKIIILINQVFVTFGVYLLIEVQTRYAYFIQITTVILMGLGIEYIIEEYQRIKNLKLKKK